MEVQAEGVSVWESAMALEKGRQCVVVVPATEWWGSGGWYEQDRVHALCAVYAACESFEGCRKGEQKPYIMEPTR